MQRLNDNHFFPAHWIIANGLKLDFDTFPYNNASVGQIFYLCRIISCTKIIPFASQTPSTRWCWCWTCMPTSNWIFERGGMHLCIFHVITYRIDTHLLRHTLPNCSFLNCYILPFWTKCAQLPTTNTIYDLNVIDQTDLLKVKKKYATDSTRRIKQLND